MGIIIWTTLIGKVLSPTLTTKVKGEGKVQNEGSRLRPHSDIVKILSMIMEDFKTHLL